MKKFLKTIAIMLAFVLVTEVPVSAANFNLSSVAAEDGQDVQAADNATNDGTDDGADGTNDGADGTNDGADGTNDGEDLKNQVIAVAFKGAKSYNVVAGEKIAVEVNVVTNSKFDYDVKWSVKGSAATVKGEGKKATITAVQGGKATVTATVGNKSASVVVNVKEYITAMNFAQDEYICYQKHKVNFADELVKTPVNGNDEITYSVDNKKVATVDKKGVVTMKKSGTTVLTAATERGVFAQTTIKVEEGNPATKISIKQGKKLTLKDVDATAELEVVVDKTKKGGETTDTFAWSSSKPAIVAVDDNGDGTATITAVGVGSSKVTVKAASGKKATITVTANAVLKSIDIVDATGADFADTYPKKKLTLSVEKDPAVSKDKISWTSSDKKLASVNNKGVVTIKAKSVAEATDVTITASTKNGVKDTFVVTINPSEITGIGAIEGNNTIWVGEEALYTADVQGGSDDEITWTSSSKKVLSITEDGYAVGLKAGKATVKATVTLASGKTKTATFKVTVKQPVIEMSMKKAVVTTFEGKKKTVSFKAVQSPKGAKEAVTYEIISDDTKSATIDAKKGKVTVPASAKAGDVIVVQATAGDVTCEGEILVIKAKNKVTFTGEGISKNKITVKQGEVFNVGAKMAYDVNEELTYSVAKPGVVSVDAEGNVYALHPGTAKVTAKTTSGAKATLTVKVVAAEVESNGTGDGNDGTTDGTTDGK